MTFSNYFEHLWSKLRNSSTFSKRHKILLRLIPPCLRPVPSFFLDISMRRTICSCDWYSLSRISWKISTGKIVQRIEFWRHIQFSTLTAILVNWDALPWTWHEPSSMPSILYKIPTHGLDIWRLSETGSTIAEWVGTNCQFSWKGRQMCPLTGDQVQEGYVI